MNPDIKGYLFSFHLYEISRIGKSIETKMTGGCQGGRDGENYLMGMGFPFGVVKMSWNQREAMVGQYYECAECH